MAKKTDTSAYQKLRGDIKGKNPGRAYVFFGEEIYLMQYNLSELKKLLVDDLTESFNYTRLNGESFTIQTFVDAVESFPMMAEHTMVQVDDIDLFKLPEEERNKIAMVLSDIPEYCTVVFTFETVAWKMDKRLKKLADAMEKFVTVVEFEKQDQRELIPWIVRRFGAQKKQISPELCLYLIEITGGTMTALAGEISKICAYSGADTICRADIDAVVEPVLDAVVFQMTDLMGQGKFNKALEKLQTLLKMQEDPILILGAVGGQIRRISAARVLLDNGRSYGELMKMYRISDYPARKTMDMAKRFSREYCQRASELILETDYRMKTSFDQKERLLEILVLQLAQEARRD